MGERTAGSGRFRRFFTGLVLLLVVGVGGWFAWDRGLFDPDDHDLVRAAMGESAGDLVQAKAVIAVFDEQSARKRSGWMRRRHGPWRFGLDAYVQALGQIMRREPASSAAQLAAHWLIRRDQGVVAGEAITVLQEHHPLSTPSDLLSTQPHRQARDLLRRQVLELQDASDRARAELALARWHLGVEKAARVAGEILALNTEEEQEERAFWKGGIALLKFADGRDPDVEHAAALELLSGLRPRVDELFPAEEIDELHSLMTRYLDLDTGSFAPEIVGTDLDGREMRLSDFRGKVVVLDFWGDW